MDTETNYSMLAYINDTFKADSIGKYISIKLLICNNKHCIFNRKLFINWSNLQGLSVLHRLGAMFQEKLEFCHWFLPNILSIRKRSFNDHLICLIFKFAILFLYIINLVVDKNCVYQFQFLFMFTQHHHFITKIVVSKPYGFGPTFNFRNVQETITCSPRVRSRRFKTSIATLRDRRTTSVLGKTTSMIVFTHIEPLIRLSHHRKKERRTNCPSSR